MKKSIALWILIGSLMISGCSSAVKAKPVPTPSTLSISVATSGSKDIAADSTAGKTAAGVGKGAAGGAASGAAGGLICGPLLWLCVPLGAVVGGLTGGVAGGISEGLKGLPSDVAKQVDATLQRIDAARDLEQELGTNLASALGGRIVDADVAVGLIDLHITRFELLQHSADRLSLRLRATMTVTWNRTAKKPTTQTNRYEYETAREAVADWLADDGARFDSGISDCVDRIGRAMVRDLTDHGATATAS